MLATVEEVTLAPVSFSDFLAAPTVGGLAAWVAQARLGAATLSPDQLASNPGAAAPITEAPLSFAQERLWFLEQLGTAGPAYNMPLGFRLRGQLDEGALERALQGVVDRHEALRTTSRSLAGTRSSASSSMRGSSSSRRT